MDTHDLAGAIREDQWVAWLCHQEAAGSLFTPALTLRSGQRHTPIFTDPTASSLPQRPHIHIHPQPGFPTSHLSEFKIRHAGGQWTTS